MHFSGKTNTWYPERESRRPEITSCHNQDTLADWKLSPTKLFPVLSKYPLHRPPTSCFLSRREQSRIALSASVVSSFRERSTNSCRMRRNAVQFFGQPRMGRLSLSPSFTRASLAVIPLSTRPTLMLVRIALAYRFARSGAHRYLVRICSLVCTWSRHSRARRVRIVQRQPGNVVSEASRLN